MPGPVLGTSGSAMHKADKVPSTCRIYILNNNNKKNIKLKQVKLKKNNFRFSDEKEQGRVLAYRVNRGLFLNGRIKENPSVQEWAGLRAELSPE